MKIIGITGNAGGGKSAAVSYFQSRGIGTISADRINTELLEQSEFLPPAIEKILQTRVTHTDGSLDKSRLRDMAFSSKQHREKLEELLHPIIMQNVSIQLALLPENRYCIIEIPLLFEAHLESRVDRVILVTASREILLARLCSRNNIKQDIAESILNSQFQDNEKFFATDDIVLNTQDLDTLHTCLDLLHNQYI
jgi:dephospho-CoA kinase